MTLRHLVDNLLKQDWMGLSLRLLVLIVGIFLGLQADVWNTGRKDLLVENQYLERLLTDAENSIQLQKSNIDWLRIVYEGNSTALKAMRSGNLPEGGLEELHRGIMFIAAAPPLRVDNTTLQEMQSSGRLGLINNIALRKMLGEMLTKGKFIEMQVAFLRESNIDFALIATRNWPFDPDLDLSNYDPVNDLGKPLLGLNDIVGNTEFENALAAGIVNKARLLTWLLEYLEITFKFRDAIRAELGLPPITEGEDRSQ